MRYKPGSRLLLAVSIFLIGCNLQKPEVIFSTDRLIPIKIDSIASARNISEFATGVAYIPLQTSNGCRIGKIRKVDFVQDRFVILASNANTKEVLVFDTLGRFSYKIDRLGTSTFRNNDLVDFEADHLSGEIYVYFNEKGYIGKYDVRNGKLLDGMDAPRFFYHFSVLPDHLLFFRDGSVRYNDEYGDSRIYEFDKHKRMQKKWLGYPINPKVNTGDIYYAKNKHNASLLISRFACDTIFQYKNSRIEALYSIDPPLQYPYDLRLAKDQSELRTMMYSDRSRYFADRIFDTKDKLYFLYKSGRSIGLNVFYKEDKRSVFIEQFNNDFSEILIPVPVYINDHNFISVVYPHLLKQQVSFVAQPDTRYDSLKSLAARVSYNDNPVLCLVTLKN
ncbi:6-bladed beta-propeller [Chitinophaga sp. XS-30]|uniref:6-bladed beta-propeller n=1 Tax=Chitinophaga sp. XS-30 TaxID=2604421 RepID=UPI0011DE48F9|nr:6-bladed beta-propeller [Chitinophaga sp. XS-30]QEH39725.1 6-bladed beta-propeller [Chitinophaga sp. XS-30]